MNNLFGFILVIALGLLTAGIVVEHETMQVVGFLGTLIGFVGYGMTREDEVI